MKNKKSKKRFAWKSKHVKKQRSRKSRYLPYNWYFGSNPPKDFLRKYWKIHRAQERNGIYQFVMGNEEYDFPYHHKHSAQWDWF